MNIYYLNVSKFENIYLIFSVHLQNISWSNVFGKFFLIVNESLVSELSAICKEVDGNLMVAVGTEVCIFLLVCNKVVHCLESTNPLTWNLGGCQYALKLDIVRHHFFYSTLEWKGLWSFKSERQFTRYDILGCWVDGTIVLLTKHLMFQVSFFS